MTATVTPIRRARWTGGGEVLHVQVCDRPGCLSRHSRVGGPATPGWKVFGVGAKVILCPFHSDDEHLPRITPVRENRTLPACTCGWAGEAKKTSMTAVMEWQDHIHEIDPSAQAG